MKMKRREILFLTVLVAVVFSANTVSSLSAGALVQTVKNSTVRGRIERQVENKTYPAAYVRVTLAPQANRTRRTTSYTGSDGMYYFRVQPGTYVLEVWDAEGKAVAKYTIKASREYVDISPLRIK